MTAMCHGTSGAGGIFRVELEKILVTHGHIDHAGAVADLAERRSLPIEGPQREDQFWIDGMPSQSRMFGLANARSFRRW